MMRRMSQPWEVEWAASVIETSALKMLMLRHRNSYTIIASLDWLNFDALHTVDSPFP